MGYIFVFILSALVVIGLLVALVGGRKRPVGQTAPGRDLTPKQPSADEPTPAASSVAGKNTAERAQRHTPPA